MIKPWLMKAQFPWVPFSTEYTTAGTQTISIPSGASFVTVECIGAGGSSVLDTNVYTGGGGAYSKKPTYSVTGLTGLYIDVPARPSSGDHAGEAASVRENNSGGTIICYAAGGKSKTGGDVGGFAVDGVGTTKYNGGGGFSNQATGKGGGGAAGATGPGGNASGTTGGTGNSPGGDGGDGTGMGESGSNYGGGAGRNNTVGSEFNNIGGQGYIKLSWT